MRRNNFRNVWIVATAVSAFWCWHCGAPTAGTSTTVGNSITGLALRADGSPAAGTLVTARAGDIVLQNDQPQSRLLAATTADDSGHFTLPVSPHADYYLEIRQCAADSCHASPPSEVFFHHYSGSLARDSLLGTVRLDVSATLTGRLIDTAAHAAGTVTWVGIRGTADFAHVNPVADSLGGEAFEVTGVYPDTFALAAVFAEGGVAAAADLAVLAPTGVSLVRPGAVTDLGPVYYVPGGG